jgi:pyruvate formate lyase activating enzyme
MKGTQTRVYHITYSGEFEICSLYFWGCNIRCRICLLKKEAFDCHLPENRLRIYDPDYRSPQPERFLSLKDLCERLSNLTLRTTFLMGAEPLCDTALEDILKYLRQEKHSRISLLTNGYQLPPLALLDEVIFSIKAVSPDIHRDYTGFDNAGILKNFRTISRAPGIRLYAETVFIPDYVDEGEVMKIAAFISSVDRELPFRIDAYLPIPGLPWRAPSVGEIESLAEKVKEVLPQATCFYGDQGNTPLVYDVEKIF